MHCDLDPALDFGEEEHTLITSQNMVNEDFEECESDDDNSDFEPLISRIQTQEEESSPPLYAGSQITVAMSMVLIMTFAIRHHLTGIALADLLSLIEIHCLIPNLCATGITQIRKFFSKLKQPLEFHYYCENGKCASYFGTTQPSNCPVCKTKASSSSHYFIIVPLLIQIGTLLASEY